MMTRRHSSLRRDETGTSLILALVFVFAIGMVLVALGGLAANALLNTSNSRAERTSAQDAENAITIAMQYLRYNPAPDPDAAPSCLPPNPTILSADPNNSATNPVQVYCTVTVSPTEPQTRVVEFYACGWGSSVSACETSNLILQAEVVYNDLNVQGIDDCYVEGSTTVTTSCGMTMNVDLWNVVSADT